MCRRGLTLTKTLDKQVHIAGLNRPKRFLEAASWIELYRSITAVWTHPMKSDFSIGDRVQMSALGAARCPRHADKTGIIVGRSIYVNCARVLLDGNKSPISVHCDYLDAILPVDAAMQSL